MRSFRFSRESVSEFIESWPSLVAAIAVIAVLIYLGWFHTAWRITLVVFAGLYIGYVLRGSLLRALQEKYPNAQFIGLLSIEVAVATAGFVVSMLFPEARYDLFNLIWLGISFFCILAFVILNRHDPDVYK